MSFGGVFVSFLFAFAGLLCCALSFTPQPSASSASDAAPASSRKAVVSGVGEAGMPPQKTGCYELTYPALRAHVQEWAERIERNKVPAESSEPQQPLYDPFAACPAPFYASLRAELAAGTRSHTLLPPLLYAFQQLDEYVGSKAPAATDAGFLCVAEAALMDAWGQLRNQPLCEMIGAPFDEPRDYKEEKGGSIGAGAAASSTPTPAAHAAAASSPSLALHVHRQPRSFYTLGMDSLDHMLSNLSFGMAYTPLIMKGVKVGMAGVSS